MTEVKLIVLCWFPLCFSLFSYAFIPLLVLVTITNLTIANALFSWASFCGYNRNPVSEMYEELCVLGLAEEVSNSSYHTNFNLLG